MTELTEAELAALQALDTPTVCNALEVVAPERRRYGFTTKPLVCARPALAPMVGYARTARIRAKTASALDAARMRQQRLDYYAYVEGGPRPSIVVIQDLDDPPGIGAFWGEVQSNIHKGLGCSGTITDGSVRDIPDAAEGFQMIAGMVGPSHAFVHLVDFDVEVSIHGMDVAPGALVHADRHGAVVIPLAVAREVPDAAALIARREAVIIGAAQAPGLTMAKLKQAFGNADDIH
ncbi:MAG: RraA family protein [Alphaproteobacteria bacterium]|jgi:regulator of RNase E activity RraA|nr:RraA family protein [Alphaproteobacteria bacterium]